MPVSAPIPAHKTVKSSDKAQLLGQEFMPLRRR